MPLSEPAPREHLHTRRIETRGYRRSDRLWEIEAHLTDVKTYSFHNDWRGTIEPGAPIHDMWARLTLDDGFAVQDVEVVTDASPFRACPEVAPNFAAVKGLTIGPGWTRRLKETLRGTLGCVHLIEMLGAMATVAIQTQARERERNNRTAGDGARAADGTETGRPVARRDRPRFIDSCYALASDGEAVRRLWPAFYTGKRDAAEK